MTLKPIFIKSLIFVNQNTSWKGFDYFKIKNILQGTYTSKYTVDLKNSGVRSAPPNAAKNPCVTMVGP